MKNSINNLRNLLATSVASHAQTLVAGETGYHVFHCPMLKKDWVQTSTAVSNPYAGKEMLTCGEIKK